MSKLVFIMGMRRSGTSLLRELVMAHDEVGNILYEPHHFMYSITISEMVRYNNDEYFMSSLGEMKGLEESPKWEGAKIALNPGIDSMMWKRIRYFFPEAKYVFITRHPKDTYDSWTRVETSIRGICDFDMYFPWHNHITESFQNIGRSCHIRYEDLIEDADSEMSAVWDLLEIDNMTGLQKRIRRK